ncbi:MAG: 4Fe-4S dicluster domain-containing protein, partial [Candidatus Aminicenantes bacterium]|nr:4Fe-4S dicluster domain-containing protein [Candidatus Aminicenantes bacterium]
MEKILTKKSFPKWIETLATVQIYAPVVKDDLWSYEVADGAEITTEYTNAIQSPKKIIFPQREFFLEFRQNDNDSQELREILPEEQESIIFGIRPCDAKGVSHMDKVFGGDFEDIYYWKRRNQTTLIGLGCNTPPSPNCFCTSVDGSPFSQEGLDVLLTDMGDYYFVQTFTKKGDKLVNMAKNLFKAPSPKDKNDFTSLKEAAEKKLPRNLKDTKSIPPKLKGLFNSELWDDEAMSCIRCGICTYLCPTCHCFDISDEISSRSPLEGKRVRNWDNCQFPDFTMHSSGHNPRPDKASRLRQRVMHKFQYFVENYNNYQCTGCGRCISK